MQDGSGNNLIRRYVHQPLTIDHFDVHCQIQTNGKIKLTKPVKGSDEYDEIEVSASLIFKLAGLLKATRKVEHVAVSSVPAADLKEQKELEQAEKTV